MPGLSTTHFFVLASYIVGVLVPKMRLPLPWSTFVGPAATPAAIHSG